MKVIKATVGNEIYVIDIDVDDPESFHREIGGFECVRTQELRSFFKKPVIMVVDDDGFAKGKELNFVASAFYHGDIVGDVIFVPEMYGEFVDFHDVESQCECMKSLLNGIV